jgi:ABC-2 type transport system ATP-binding protein
MTASGIAIEVLGLTKYYGKLAAVNDLSLCIEKGEIYGFLGLNGAGKTTTIRMLLGMIKSDAGTVSLFGTRIHPGLKSIWEKVGYMVETPHSYPELTVRENLEIIERLRYLKSPDTVDRVIDQLGLRREEEKPAGKLSLGNAQRLGLAKALIHNPGLLILDEPVNGLDPAGIVEIRNLLRELAEKSGVTIFISSHILSEVSKLTTRIGIIHEGRLINELDAGEIEKQEQRYLEIDTRDNNAAMNILREAGYPVRQDINQLIRITDTNALDHPDTIATLLVETKCAPTRLAIEHSDLETYFLSLVGRGGESN